MERIEGLVRDLREGDVAAKEAAARALDGVAFYNDAGRILIADAGAVPPLVELLRDGSATAKYLATGALGNLARNNAANHVLIAEAGGIAALVELLRDGIAGVHGAKLEAARALFELAYGANTVLIAEAGGIPPLVDLLRDGSVDAKLRAAWTLENLAFGNAANAVAIAAAVGFDALVQLARSGDVTVDNRFVVVRAASLPAKREAALAVAALLRDYVPEFESVPDVLMAAIVSYL